MSTAQPAGALTGRWFQVRPGEWSPTVLAFCYFGLLLASYYTLRPVRDALVTSVIGAEEIRFGFLATFGVMLALVPVFGSLAARLPRRRLIPVVYVFFIASILVIRGLFGQHEGERWLAYFFFVWLSVFNLFVVSVFWSFMADIFDEEAARRLFGPIAAGGSVGAIVGPLITRTTVEAIGVADLMLVSAVLLGGALGCMLLLARRAPRDRVIAAEPMGGSPLEGLRLAVSRPFLRGVTGFMILGTLTGSLLYLFQVQLAAQVAEDTDQLAAFFASVDLAVNFVSILCQLLLTGRILARLGVGKTLAILPLLVLLGFAVLAAFPVLAVAIAMQILRRSVLFSITNPVSQMLFTVVGPRSKYKFKNFLDTAVYRAGDTTGSWVFAGLMGVAGLPAVAAFGAVAGIAFIMLSGWIGRRFEAISNSGDAPP
ncbi:MAG: MFS transporter [Pseudomonadota bacterium]